VSRFAGRSFVPDDSRAPRQLFFEDSEELETALSWEFAYRFPSFRLRMTLITPSNAAMSAALILSLKAMSSRTE